ncbi:MAG TPA: DUF309 domain-containing protein [Thermoanaerobaculia bacterium]|nr:DUF309 domain-containing protein [Thermoanaerobaculia bacterium]
MKPDFVAHFREGVAHFNATEFWHAHESWETLWLASTSDVKQFLQGLIQVAAAFHHVKRGTLSGATRLFEAGMAKLAPFPHGFCGLDRSSITVLSSDFPKLREIAIAPPAEDW